MTLPSPNDLRTALLAARRMHQSGGGAVLDVLLRSTPPDKLSQLERWLDLEAGVRALWSPDQATPDHAGLPLTNARDLSCVAVRLAGEPTSRLAMLDPWDDEQVRRAAELMGTTPQLAVITAALLDRWLGMPAATVAAGPAQAALTEGGAVVDFVDAAIRAAYSGGASDVHFECDRDGVTVKFRLDGVMSGFARMNDPARAEEVISRIKVLAQLDITERRTPQDGRFRFASGEAAVDLRVSIMPSVFGEDAVLRLLDKAQLRSREDSISLDRLGFDARSAGSLRELADLPHGMLLVTGPTGSGKTTTVYALLTEVNRGDEKIITIEDPVEYELPGVLQIPVNDRKGLTFAKGLRSILRHDPDRILVGEIRDAETAEIAVQSALTGHQVFTTVHANSVFDVVGRFRHFGLDMYGFMSSLNGIVVQRLVRVLCPHCCGDRTATQAEIAWFLGHGLATTRVPKPVGCDTCHASGYRGRSVLAEVHDIDDQIRDLVTSGASLTALRAHIESLGIETLQHQAARRVMAGLTTAEEIKRVVGWR